MKHCFLISVFYFSAAFYGMTYTSAQDVGERNFKTELKKYIDTLRPDAKRALSAKEWHLGLFVDWGSYFSSKGNSVDINELKLFTSYSDGDYQEAIAAQDFDEIQKFAHNAYNEIKYEKDSNKWHDQLYDVISKYNSEILFQDKNLSRPVAMKKMLENKNDSVVKKRFVFGIAVTKTVEDMMKTKK